MATTTPNPATAGTKKNYTVSAQTAKFVEALELLNDVKEKMIEGLEVLRGEAEAEENFDEITRGAFDETENVIRDLIFESVQANLAERPKRGEI